MPSAVTHTGSNAMQPSALGYFGKYPEYPDFVQYALPVNLVMGWKAWVASYMSAGYEQLDDIWLDAYLQSPVWRFCLFDQAIAPSSEGVDGWLGAMMPSVDSRGRYFPLLAAAPVPRCAPVALLRGAQDFLDDIESRLIRCLSEPHVPPDQLTSHFTEELPALMVPAKTHSDLCELSDDTWARKFLDDYVGQATQPISVWQAVQVADGGQRVFACSGLPAPAAFATIQCEVTAVSDTECVS